MAESVQPLVQPPIEDIRNAAQIANGWAESPEVREWRANARAFEDIARLLRLAIVKLSEPNLAAMQAGEILLKEWSGTPEPQRQLRDTIAGILRAQVTGEIPRTWSH